MPVNVNIMNFVGQEWLEINHSNFVANAGMLAVS
jgi:hypothetical protein